MDYEKAYKDALERARKSEENSNGMILKKWLWNIFPELAKSDDEKIRKGLIGYFMYLKSIDKNVLSDITNDNILTWLEKQGETFTKKDVDDAYLKGISDARNELEKQDNTPKKVTCTHEVEVGNGNIKALVTEKIPTDKVEAKFHKGQWIVNKGHSYLIADIDYLEHRYLFEIGGYTHEQLNWEYIEIADKRYHLWTIQDAKDGDVLYSPWCGLLWIFEDEKKCHVGYNLNYNSDSIVINKPICIPADVQPATKEQRDILMKAMADAGYEWDAEKKELKLLITNGGDFESENYDGEDYGIDGLWHAKNILEETLGKVDGYQTDDGILEHKCAIEVVNKLYRQKPMQKIEPFEVEHGKYYYCIKDYFCGGRKQASKGDVVQALRGLPIMGLKDASEYFLPVNFAWSEENSVRLQRIIDFLWKNRKGDTDGIYQQEQDIDWLKSLKKE